MDSINEPTFEQIDLDSTVNTDLISIAMTTDKPIAVSAASLAFLACPEPRAFPTRILVARETEKGAMNTTLADVRSTLCAASGMGPNLKTSI
jgi:hypothetical protein